MRGITTHHPKETLSTLTSPLRVSSTIETKATTDRAVTTIEIGMEVGTTKGEVPQVMETTLRGRSISHPRGQGNTGKRAVAEAAAHRSGEEIKKAIT